MAWVRSHCKATAELGVCSGFPAPKVSFAYETVIAAYRSGGLSEEDRIYQFFSSANSLLVGAAEDVDTDFCATT